jgi:phosphatidate cytidylyltransferase
MIRVLSAVVLIAIVATTVWWMSPWATVVLAAVTAAAAASELAGLSRLERAVMPTFFIAASAAIVCVALAATAVWPSVSTTGTVVAIILAATLATGLVVLAAIPPGPAVFPALGAALLAPVYVGLPLGALAWVRASGGPAAVTWLVLVVAVSDSAQYYVGTRLGRTKLSPVISPGKTVEGAVGGLVVAPIVGALLAGWALPQVPAASAAVLSVMLCAFGISGDLFESLLKRSAGVKDSSTLIPGHGGVLDRIDAYLFAAPVFYLFLRYLA